MKYQSVGRTPGTLVPRNKEELMRNPGTQQDPDLASGFLVREIALVRDLIGAILKSPNRDKAEQHWDYFQTQWKQNTINYIKHELGNNIVTDVEVADYRNNFKYKTALRLVEEYILKLREQDRISARYPNVPAEKNVLLSGLKINLNEIHSRLMPYWKQLKEPDFTIMR